MLAASMVLALCAACGSSVTPEELVRRVESSRLTWESYSEEIKAQLGAEPAAEWEGTLLEIQATPQQVQAVFSLRGPWASRAVAAPILLNEPLSGVHQNESAQCEGGRVTYTFPLRKEAGGVPLPWVELKYPGGQRRVALSDKGIWSASQTE